MIADDVRLDAVGEFRLIDGVLLPLAEQLGLGPAAGDDCTYVTGGETLAISADVGPTPLLHALPGYDSDFEARGWLAVVATASDVATAGAMPRFLTNCVDAPAALTVGEFRAIMTGVFKACVAFGFANGGGDLRQAPTLRITTFGAGAAPPGSRLGRSGANSGDHVYLIGPAGSLMATYLLARAGCDSVTRDGRLLPPAEALLRYPRPQLEAMRAIVEAGLPTAASDTSDGVLGAIGNITSASSCGVALVLNRAMLSPEVERAACATGYDPWNIFFSWGDWSVVVMVSPDRVDEFEDLCREQKIIRIPLGKVTPDPGGLTAHVDGAAPVAMTMVRNENFAPLGFNAKLSDHLRYLLETPLFGAKSG